MARRKSKRKESGPADVEPVDEREWEDWRRLRAELGERLGSRDATGESDPDVLKAARRAGPTRR